MRNRSAQQLHGVCPTEAVHPGFLSVQAQAGEPEYQCLKARALNCIDCLGALSLPLRGLRVEISKSDLDQSRALIMHHSGDHRITHLELMSVRNQGEGKCHLLLQWLEKTNLEVVSGAPCCRVLPSLPQALPVGKGSGYNWQ